MFGNLNLIEIALIGAAVYFGVTKQDKISNKWQIAIIAAVVLLVFFMGGGTSSPLGSFFGITIGGINITLILIVGAVLYFAYRKGEQGDVKNNNILWLVLGGIFLLSSFSSSSTL